MKRVMVLGAGFYQRSLIVKLKEMGCYVISVDCFPDNVGHIHADDNYNLSTLDRERLLELARKERVDAVMTHASDIAMPSVGYINDHLGFNGITFHQAELFTKKTLFRKFQVEKGFACPDFFPVDAGQDLEVLFEQLNPGKKYIIKPADRSGSLAIRTFEAGDGMFPAFCKWIEEALACSFESRAVVEELLEGDQFSVEGFFVRGELQSFFTKKSLTPHPFRIPLSHITPNPLRRKDLVEREIEAMLNSMNVENTVFDVDGVVDGNGHVVLLEMALRTGGNFIPEIIRMSTGIDLVDMAIGLALGLSVSTKTNPSGLYAGVKLIAASQRGSVRRVKESSVKTDGGEARCVLTKAEGDSFEAFRCGADSLGHVFAVGGSIEQIEAYFDQLSIEDFYELEF